MSKCRKCNDTVSKARWDLGYRICLDCGDRVAQIKAKTFCVAIPFNKGAYQYIHNPSDLKITNPKRTT